MHILTGLSAFILLLALPALVAGLVRPSLFRKLFGPEPTRKKVSLTFGLVSLVAFVIVGITAPKVPEPANPQPVAQTSATPTVSNQTPALSPAETKTAVAAPAPSKPAAPAPDAQLKQLVANVLSGNNNNSEPYLRSVDVVSQINGGWGVFVEMNADSNLTSNMTKQDIELEMTKVYTAIYTSGIDVKTASVAAYLPGTDQYGNSSDFLAYKTILPASDGDKVNWKQDPAVLGLQVLPNLWETTILAHALQ